MNRRTFVRNMCYGGLATFALPRVTFAQVRHSGRLVFVLLRGGFDGLANPLYEYETMSDDGEAVQDMDGIAVGDLR